MCYIVSDEREREYEGEGAMSMNINVYVIPADGRMTGVETNQNMCVRFVNVRTFLSQCCECVCLCVCVFVFALVRLTLSNVISVHFSIHLKTG